MYFFCIPASAADAAAVNPNGIKTLLANGLITFFINGKPVFNNGPRSLPRNPLFLTALFSLFSCQSDILAFTVLYSTIYMFLQHFGCSFAQF